MDLYHRLITVQTSVSDVVLFPGTINMCDEETSDPLVTSAQSQLTLKAPRGTVRLTCLDWLTALSLYKALEDVDWLVQEYSTYFVIHLICLGDC